MDKKADRCYTIAELCRRWRVGEAKILGWIDRGQLVAFNVAANLCGRRQLRVTPEAVAEFEKRRDQAPPPRPVRQKRVPKGGIDYFPD